MTGSGAGGASAEYRRIAERFWQLMNANDFQGAGQLFHDDFTCDYPQSGERFRGRDSWVAFNVEYPAAGPWSFTVHRLIVDDSGAVSEVTVSDTALAIPAISFFEFRDGRIWRMTEYWPDPFDAPANRGHLVERVTGDG